MVLRALQRAGAAADSLAVDMAATTAGEEGTSMQVSVSVLVPVLNEGSGVRDVVAAMQSQRYSEGEIEFIFADGRSDDDTRACLEQAAAEDPRIRVLDNPSRGTASGLNVCLAAARGEYVARMDAHTVYPPDYLALGVERLRRGDVAWVAGPQVPEGVGPVGRAVAVALTSPLGRGGSRKWEGAQEPAAAAEHDLDTGVFCGVWRRKDLLSIGGFDEGWPRNQDSELAARFLREGRRIVCLPSMGARYRPRESLGALWRQYRLYGIYRAKTARRHPTSLRRSAVLPPLVVLDAVAVAVAPRSLRRVAFLGIAVYAVALIASTVPAPRQGKRGTVALVPAVLATMHAAHGVGFLEGVVRWGLPSAALLRIAGLRADPDDEAAYRGPISAPSLAS